MGKVDDVYQGERDLMYIKDKGTECISRGKGPNVYKWKWTKCISRERGPNVYQGER